MLADSNFVPDKGGFGVNINNIVFVMGCWLIVTMYLIEIVCGLSVRVGCRGRVRGVG